MATLQIYIGSASHLIAQADCLPASEQAHAAALGLGTDSERALSYTAGRVLLRQALARVLGCQPADVPLEKTVTGKLVCHAEQGDKPVHISLSHTAVPSSADGPAEVYAACSLSRDCSNGVDIEWSHRRPRWRATAKRRFHASEWADMEAADEGAGRQAFLRLWCLKEARVKMEDGQLLDSLARPVPSAVVHDVSWPANMSTISVSANYPTLLVPCIAPLGARISDDKAVSMRFAAFSLPLPPVGKLGGTALLGAVAARTDENLTIQLTSFL